MKSVLNSFALFAMLLTGPSLAKPTEFLTHFIKPFSYEEEGSLQGIAVELVKEMMLIRGEEHNIQLVPFPRGLYTVQNHPDTALFIVARRPEREETVKWVGPLISSSVYFYKHRDAQFTCTDLEAMKQLSYIGVGRQNADHTYLRELGFNNLYPTNNQLVSLQMLALRRVDATPMSELVMPEMANQAGIDISEIERTNIKLYDSVLYLAFSLNTPDSEIEKWQNALDALIANGKYKTIKSKYLSPPSR